jgi:hypothetical protein
MVAFEKVESGDAVTISSLVDAKPFLQRLRNNPHMFGFYFLGDSVRHN